MVHDRCNYFSCWAIFCPFTPPNKNQNLKKLKKKKRKKNKTCGDITIYTSASKIIIICYTVPEIWHVTDAIVKKNHNLKKMEKRSGDIMILYTCTKIMIR